MIARSSADMVDLFLFSLGQAEALVRMTIQSELRLLTAHTICSISRSERKPYRVEEEQYQRMRSEKEKQMSQTSTGVAGGPEETEKKTGLHRWIRGLGMYYCTEYCVLYFFFVFGFYIIFYYFSWNSWNSFFNSPPN